MRLVSTLLLGLLFVGCHPGASRPSATSSPDPIAILVSKAETAHTSGDRETEALALREAMEKVSRSSPDSPQLPELRKQCVDAMVEAGGNADSYKLWSRIEKERPTEAAAAKRMVKRAKEMMIQQGAELLAQVEIDEKAGHHQSALCSALAAQELFVRSSAGASEQASAQRLVSRLSKKLKVAL